MITPNNPESREDRVLLYLEGDMTPEEEARFRDDLRADAELRRIHDEYREQDRLLHAWFEAQGQRADKVRRPDLGATVVAATVRGGRRLSATTWALAAAAAFALVAGGTYFAARQSSHAVIAEVQNTTGPVQVFSKGTHTVVTANAAVPVSTDRVKVPAGGRAELAFVQRNGGMELRENSAIRFSGGASRPIVDLERGEMIVRTSGPELKPVVIRTPQFEAEATDATFSVIRGLRGAEVAVIDGTVTVRRPSGISTVSAGRTYSTGSGSITPIGERVNWSINRREYLSMLQGSGAGRANESPNATSPLEVASVVASAASGAIETQAASVPGGDADAQPATVAVPSAMMSAAAVAAPSVNVQAPRSTLYMPAETVFIVEIPSIDAIVAKAGANAGEDLADVLLGARAEQAVRSAAALIPVEPKKMTELQSNLTKVFSNDDLNLVLGSLGGPLTVSAGNDHALLVGQVVRDQQQVASLVNGKLEPWLNEQAGQDPGRARAAVAGNFLVLGFGETEFQETVLAAQIGVPTAFGRSPFLATVENETAGSQFTAAWDTKSFVADVAAQSPRAERFLTRFGLANMNRVVAATSFTDQARNRALRVHFDGQRQGLMNWIGEPAPMSSFQFFSSDAHAIYTMRVRRPAEMLDQLLQWHREDFPNSGEPDIALQQQFLSTLGNEIAIGLENPVLPIPNVKVAIEVVDPIRFHDTMLQLIDALWANTPRTATAAGPDINASSYRGHLVVDFRVPGSPLAISYAVLDDFVVFGPGRPFLVSTVDTYLDQKSIAYEQSFLDALPDKSGSWCSALMYVGVGESLAQAGPVLTGFAQMYGLPAGIGNSLAPARTTATGQSRATVVYAIAQQNSIDFFIEGVRGNYGMTALVPAVADWIRNAPAR